MVSDCPPAVHECQNLALLHRLDARAYPQHLGFPVLLVTGSEDHLTTETVHDRTALALPDAEAKVVPGAGNLMKFEKPVDLARIIDGWLPRRTLMVGAGTTGLTQSVCVAQAWSPADPNLYRLS